MHRLDITQTNLAAVADPEEVVLVEEIDGDLPPASLPAAPRSIAVDEVSDDGARHPAPAVIGRTSSLAVEVPPGAASMVLLALDADGQVIASRDLELETAMPAEVFLDLLASGLIGEGLESVDLHVRITPEVAGALAAAARRVQEARRTQPIPRQQRAVPAVPLAAAPRRGR